jgi:hypothetical protein
MLLLPLYFQTVHGTAPAQTGLLMGVGTAAMPMIVLAYAALSTHALADGTSLLGLGQRIAGSLGTSLLAVVLQHQLSIRDTRADAFRHTYLWAAVLTATSRVQAAALTILKRRRRLAMPAAEARFHKRVGKREPHR